MALEANANERDRVLPIMYDHVGCFVAKVKC